MTIFADFPNFVDRNVELNDYLGLTNGSLTAESSN